jgi:transposase InsO family protein
MEQRKKINKPPFFINNNQGQLVSKEPRMAKIMGQRPREKTIKCWSCNGDHMYQNCLHRAKKVRLLHNVEKVGTIEGMGKIVPRIYVALKNEYFENFKEFKALVENEADLKIKCLRSDKGGEFISNEFEEFFETHGIKINFLSARNTKQNGVVKIKNGTVREMKIIMLNESNISDRFWREAVNTKIYIMNRGKI